MHPTPPILTGGPPAVTVLIGGQPAWKGIPLAAAPGIMATSTSTQATLQTLETTALAAEAAAVAAAGTPGAPAAVAVATAARLAAETAKASSLAANSASIAAAAAGGSSTHACALPWPLPPHGPGVVIDGSATVMIENCPACRLGDTIIEAIGPPNKIVMGCPTVMIGDSGSGSSLSLAFSLIDIRGSADGQDALLVATELAKFPPDVLQVMIDNGTRVVVCRGSVTDYRADLRGVQPRGWPPGATWDNVPGANTPDRNEVVIATIGHGTPAGAHVPATGEGHGSSNLVLHESAHSIDDPGKGAATRSSGADFNRARTADIATLDPYFTQPGAAGQEETYAESAARYYGGATSDATQHSNLHNYWATDPLNPNP